MADASSENNLRQLQKLMFDRVKRWWIGSLACKVWIVVINVIAVFISNQNITVLLAVVTFLLVVVSEATLLYSDRLKSDADELLQTLDEYDLFGTPLLRSYQAELRLLMPRYFAEPKVEVAEPYFAKTTALGAAKALTNLEESSWWSAKLAARMRAMIAGAVVVLVALPIVILLLTISLVASTTDLVVLLRVSIMVMSSVSALTLVRLVVGYHNFNRSAAKVADTCCQLHEAGNTTVETARWWWNRYLRARSAAPLLPSLVWRWMAEDLNAAWQQRSSLDT